MALDDALVNIRQEGWKELKVSCVFEVAVKPSRDPQTGDWIDLAHAQHNSYIPHLGGPEVFGQAVWAEARRRGSTWKPLVPGSRLTISNAQPNS